MSNGALAEVVDRDWRARLDALAALVDAGHADGVVRCSDRDLTGLVLALESGIRRLQALQSVVAAEAGMRGVPAAAGCKDAAGWLRSLTNLSPAQARVRAQVGQALLTPPRSAGPTDPDLAPLRGALLSGAVTGEHALVVLEAADRLAPPAIAPDALDPAVRTQVLGFLTEHAATLHVHQLGTLARRLVTRLDPDGDDRLARDEDRQAAYRGMTLSRMRSGMVHLTGTLTSECAGLLATAIDAGSAPRPAADGSPDDRTAAMRRHDSLQQLCRQMIAADGVLPTTHGAAYRLVVTVPLETVSASVVGDRVDGEPARLPDGWPLSGLTTATTACAGELVPVSVDRSGNPLDVGDAQYLFPPRIRMAIIARDQHCTWPGCTAPASWCDTHHLTPYSAGGATSVDNGALLCGRHHRHVHRHGYIGEVIEATVRWNLSPPQLSTSSPDSAIARRLVDHLAHLAHRQRRHLTRRRQ